ncbi:MAG: hypothetical protein J6J60_02570 [Clostridia bacterium]|nr:hypothetical protein [Clostridia bacterium]
MRKNNKITVFTIIAIILTIIALIITSSTYAKYTSSVDTTTANATVAKWSVKINDQDITQDSTSIDFDLFSTIYDTGASEEEEDVVDGKIAPGTAGGFNFEIENSSEVTIKYSIAFTETNASNIPIEYSIDGENFYASAEFTEELNNNAQTIDMGDSKLIEVSWRWAYEGGVGASQTDETDTELGTATTTPTYNVKATIIATQVD